MWFDTIMFFICISAHQNFINIFLRFCLIAFHLIGIQKEFCVIGGYNRNHEHFEEYLFYISYPCTSTFTFYLILNIISSIPSGRNSFVTLILLVVDNIFCITSATSFILVKNGQFYYKCQRNEIHL